MAQRLSQKELIRSAPFSHTFNRVYLNDKNNSLVFVCHKTHILVFEIFQIHPQLY